MTFISEVLQEEFTKYFTVLLSYFKSSSGGKFKYYSYYVLGAASLALLVALISFNFNAVSYVFLILVILTSLTCFIFSAMKIYEMTGVEIDFGHKRFSYEEHRQDSLYEERQYLKSFIYFKQISDLPSTFHSDTCNLDD